MFSVLIRIYKFIQIQYLFWKKELNPKIKVDIFTRFNMIRKGFHGESAIIYDLTSYIDMYLTDKQRLKSKFINYGYSKILNNKIIFEKVFSDSLNIPTTFGIIEKGKITFLNPNLKDIDDLILYINKKSTLVFKPISGGGGFGVKIIKYYDSSLTINNETATIEEFKALVNELDSYFISEYIEQGEFSKKFNPNTLNSIRIVTMIDPIDNNAFIPIAVYRIGTKQSSPADNWTQGGISALIDIETGRIGKGVIYPRNGKKVFLEKHPETGARIEEQLIPNWDKIKEKILNASNKHKYIKYIGWDVVITDEGIKVIEGNNCSDMNLLQVHKPILGDVRVRSFFSHYDII